MKKTVLPATKTEANTQAFAREPAAEHSTPSWASDHNYNAVKPERTAAISSSLLFKCMYRIGIFLNNHLHSLFNYPSILGSARLGSLGFGVGCFVCFFFNLIFFKLIWHQTIFLHLQRFSHNTLIYEVGDT